MSKPARPTQPHDPARPGGAPGRVGAGTAAAARDAASAGAIAFTDEAIDVPGFEKPGFSMADMTVQLRLYRSTRAARGAPLVLHLHGGAFTFGNLDNGLTVAQALVEAGAVVAALDYPLAPAHPFPAALHAGQTALQWLHANRVKLAGKNTRLFIAGEEAGGNLAAAVAMKARDYGGPPLTGQILISPMLDPRVATQSARDAACGPVGCRWADGWKAYLDTAEKAAHPYAAIVSASRLTGLPPALVLTAEDDPMRDESLAYAARLRAAGVPVQHHSFAAPTGFPCALLQPTTGPGSPACAGADPDAAARATGAGGATTGSQLDRVWRTTLAERFSIFFSEFLGLAPTGRLAGG
jgi:acetyl esterase